MQQTRSHRTSCGGFFLQMFLNSPVLPAIGVAGLARFRNLLMRIAMQRIGLVILLALAPVLAQAQTYKWVDANGSTQYSDHPPPPGVKYDKIDTRPTAAAQSSPSAAGATNTNYAAEELEFRKRQIAAEEKQKEEEQKEKDAQAKQVNCGLAQSRLKILQDGGRILKPTTNGERDYMGDQEIQDETVKAQQAADKACK
jgi:Domain of unknown function (DUF4124)